MSKIAGDGLVGYWPLERDARDLSGHANDGVVEGGSFGPLAGQSRRGYRPSKGGGVMVPSSASLDLGADPFTVAAWVETDELLGDVLGDVVAKFDPQAKRGFNFSLLNYSITSHHPNHRNIQFGIDAGSDPIVEDRGRPGETVYVLSLCVFDGSLYAGTFEALSDRRGRVYRYDAIEGWVDCGAPDGANSVSGLAVLDGHLYASTAFYKSRGSALSDSENTTPGGSVYRYVGGDAWEWCGRIDIEDAHGYPGVEEGDIRSAKCDTIGTLISFEGHLYAAPWYTEGVFRYDGGTTWTSCGSPGRRLLTMVGYSGDLWVAGHDGRPVVVDASTIDPFSETFRSSGDGRWESEGTIDGVTQVYSYAVFGDQLYAGAWPDGSVYRFAGGKRWDNVGRLGEEREVMAMAVYNGRLIAGTLPSAELYAFQGDGDWVRLGRLDFTPDVKYRRVWSMAVFDGHLFAGTLPSGHVQSIRLGDNVTFDRVLPAGSHHLAARRTSDSLELFVDGEPVARRSLTRSLDISNSVPLMIGRGQHASLRGAIADVRIYNRDLGDHEIAAFAGAREAEA